MGMKKINSCALAAIAVLLLKSKGAIDVHRLDAIISMLDNALDTKRKRHIAGGILMSASLLFGGLAITILTLKTEEDEREKYLE